MPKFHSLILNKDGDSELDCCLCGKDAKYINFDTDVGRYFCAECKDNYKEERCKECGRLLKGC
jgi:hypothetical protein